MTARLGGRGGRERVGAGGVADAAWSGESTSEVRLDHDELKEMATTEFAPPEGITPAMGGIILAESVQPEHKVAWLIEARSEEHTSELQSLMSRSYAVFCLTQNKYSQ